MRIIIDRIRNRGLINKEDVVEEEDVLNEGCDRKVYVTREYFIEGGCVEDVSPSYS